MAAPDEFDLLVDWQEDAVRGRRRESLMAAGVLHLGLLLLAIVSPAILAAPRVVKLIPVEPRDLTILTLPPDLNPQPKEPALTPEEREQMARRKSLTIGPRELEAVIPPANPSEPSDRIVINPGGVPAPSPTPGGEPGAPGGEDKGALASKEVARLEDLPQRPGAGPKLDLPTSSPGRTIEEGLKRGQGGPGGPPGGDAGPVQPNFDTPFPTILSDTRGVDFTPYLIRLLREVRRNWYAVIPESARWGEQGRVVIVFTIMKDGAVPLGQPTIVRSSGRSHLDRPALAAIRASQPFPPLPAEFTGDNIVLQFTFLYNLPLDYREP
jgi:TonB family protein